MLVVSHTTGGGGGVRASDVTHYFNFHKIIINFFIMQNYDGASFHV